MENIETIKECDFLEFYNPEFDSFERVKKL